MKITETNQNNISACIGYEGQTDSLFSECILVFHFTGKGWWDNGSMLIYILSRFKMIVQGRGNLNLKCKIKFSVAFDKHQENMN